MEKAIQSVDQLVKKYLDEVIQIRRTIHQNPELSLQEFETAKTVYNSIKDLDLKIQEGVANTGVVATLNSHEEKRTIMLRADMDALPLDELSDLEFKSTKKGVMHACGHDVHTAILIGAAKVLNELKDDINGNVKFVFQPAEENNPTGGAPLMIEEGVLENPKVDAAIALHVWDMPVGTIATKKGPIMSQSDRIFITIKGVNSHASAPQNGKDAIICASHLITSLQTIVSRNISPADSAVVTISKIMGGTRYNILCDEVNLEGTVRCSSNAVGEFLPKRIEEIIKGVCATFGCEYEFEYINGYPVTYNDDNLAEKVLESIKNTVGKENTTILSSANTGGEDFSFFTRKVPSHFMFLGCKSEMNKDKCIIHNPNFICDEDCIEHGIKALVNIVIDYLNK